MGKRKPSFVLGTYRTPVFKYGQVVTCQRFGEVRILGSSDAPIPWPLCRPVDRNNGLASLVLYRDLVRAVKRESVIDLCRLFGVGHATARLWRHALGIAGTRTPGTFRRLSTAAKRNYKRVAGPAMIAARKADDAWKEKIAAARRGKPRPKHVIEALRRAHTGRPASLPPAEVAKRTGRSVTAVYLRRRKLRKGK